MTTGAIITPAYLEYHKLYEEDLKFLSSNHSKVDSTTVRFSCMNENPLFDERDDLKETVLNRDIFNKGIYEEHSNERYRIIDHKKKSAAKPKYLEEASMSSKNLKGILINEQN